MTTTAVPASYSSLSVLSLGNFGLSYEQSKTQMAMWAIFAAPLLMSVDLRTLKSEYKGRRPCLQPSSPQISTNFACHCPFLSALFSCKPVCVCVSPRLAGFPVVSVYLAHVKSVDINIYIGLKITTTRSHKHFFGEINLILPFHQYFPYFL